MNFDQYTCLSFDCYGTLIDWETGLLSAIHSVLDNYRVKIADRELLELYALIESQIEEEYRSYREVLGEVLQEIGKKFDFSPSSAEIDKFSESVKNWPAFADSTPALRALQSKYKLMVLSNIDDDLFEYSNKILDVQFDGVFTAQKIGAYKPSLLNFRYLIENAGTPKMQMLHVAQSLYHDILPAKQLGLSTVWVNRRNEKIGFGATPAAEVEPDLEVPDLRTLATMMGVL